jgi:predicted outer membrane repeat protein
VPSWLEGLLTLGRRSATSQRRRRCRPAFDCLEDRCAPAVLTVNSLADNTTSDSSLTLREAIMTVNGTLGRPLSAGEQAAVSGTLSDNDTVQFSIPSGPQKITLTDGTLSITRAVAITGPGASSLTISGGNVARVFHVGSSFSQNLSLSVSMSGLTIADGTGAYGGGLFSSASLTLSHTTFSNNAATNNGGGALYNNGALILSDCSFSSNTTHTGSNGPTGGGALYNISAGSAVLTRCVFTGNTAPGSGADAGSAGAIYSSGALNLSACIFDGNSAGSDAGALFARGTTTATSCTFINNSAGADGGGVHATGTLTLTGCLFAWNTAVSSGGGMEMSITGYIALTISNSTFANNTAGSTAGGLIIWEPGANLTNVTVTGNRAIDGEGLTFAGGIWANSGINLHNSIVTGTFKGSAAVANDIHGICNSISSYNLIGSGGAGGLTNGVNGNQVGVANPGLGSLSSNGGPTQTIPLLAGSPAIDRGGNANVAPGATDQRGLPRIVNGTTDIGAFEVQAPTPTTTAVATSNSPSTYGEAVTFTATVASTSTPIGDVTFTIDGVAVAGVAGATTPTTATWTFTSSTLSVGTHAAAAVFHGSNGFGNSTGPAITQQVNRANATVRVDPYAVTYDGQPHLPIVVSVMGVNGESGQAVGTVHLSPARTEAGTHVDSWMFVGGPSYNDIASTPITNVIRKAPSTVVVTINGGPFTYNGLPHTPATVVVSGVGFSFAPPASYANNVDAGTATAFYHYAGDVNHEPSSDSKNFTIRPPHSIGVYRPGNQTFYLDRNANGRWDGPGVDRSFVFGIADDVPLTGDWSGSGTTKIGVYRPSNISFYLDFNGNGRWDGATIDRQYRFGSAGDTPISGDWDGDGKFEIGIHRARIRTFCLDMNGNGRWDPGSDARYLFGSAGDIPVVGKWHGSVKSQIGLYRPNTQTFCLDSNGNHVWDGPTIDAAFVFGSSSDKPLAGQWS